MTRTAPRRIVSCAAILLSLAVAPLIADGGPQHQVPQSPPIQLGTSGGSAGGASRAF